MFLEVTFLARLDAHLFAAFALLEDVLVLDFAIVDGVLLEGVLPLGSAFMGVTLSDVLLTSTLGVTLAALVVGAATKGAGGGKGVLLIAVNSCLAKAISWVRFSSLAIAINLS